MNLEDFIAILHNQIRTEIIAISKVDGNTIRVHFNDGKVLKLIVTE